MWSLGLAAAAGLVAFVILRPTDDRVAVDVEGAVEGEPAPVPTGSSSVVRATTAPPPIEGLYDPDEVLPEIRVGDRMRVGRLPVKRGQPGRPDLYGKLIVDGIVSARDVWLRWDADATKTRFLKARFPVPHRLVTDGEVMFGLEPLVPALREGGFSARLDGSVLRIGAAGVYPAPAEPEPPPDNERLPD